MSERPRGPRLDWISDHIRLYQQDPERAHLWDSSIFGGKGLIPTLLLSTKGRKTGLPNVAPVIYGKAGANFIIIGSKGGAPTHTAWYLNLSDNPDCEIQVARDHYRCRARTALGDERTALWAKMRTVYPLYDEYQSRTEREIPVIVLEPQP
jgi:deazaflavin-dependent oxidoreductase (nitroreductase family)